MNSRRNTPKTPFDNLVSTIELDMMKLLIPFIPAQSQAHFAVYIKFQELQETMRIFKRYPSGIRACDLCEDEDSADMFSMFKPYLPEESQGMFDNISNMMNMMEMMKQMQAMNEAMNEGSDDSTDNDSSMDFLKAMLSPEQQAMFESMSQMQDMADIANQFQESNVPEL
ncbi:MAG: hypothetical protein R3Y58_06500 [Eubacteriales bacterium]